MISMLATTPMPLTIQALRGDVCAAGDSDADHDVHAMIAQMPVMTLMSLAMQMPRMTSMPPVIQMQALAMTSMLLMT